MGRRLNRRLNGVVNEIVRKLLRDPVYNPREYDIVIRGMYKEYVRGVYGLGEDMIVNHPMVELTRPVLSSFRLDGIIEGRSFVASQRTLDRLHGDVYNRIREGRGLGKTNRMLGAHEDCQAFENLQINKGEIIPQYYTKKDQEYLPGPPRHAPYSKQPHTNYVLLDEHTELHIQNKEGISQTYPRLVTFKSNESHPINLYWECVKELR